MADTTTKSVTLADISAKMTEIQTVQKTHADKMAEMSKPVYRHQLSTLFNEGRAPGAIVGESPNTSRGYSFIKLFGLLAKQLSPEECKVEIDMHNRFQKAYVDQGGYVKGINNAFMAPLSSKHLCLDDQFAMEVRQITKAGVSGYDPDEAMWHLTKAFGSREKAMSWIDDTVGGALVSPPMQGELIELLRNNEALMQAGARDIGMPPNGRITFPRQTGGATAYWVGQSQTITDSQPTTGDVILTAKKLAVIVKIPNELFRFASISVEQFVREDIARVMQLKLDKSLLESVGSNVEPKGLITYANITTHTAATTGANGDTFSVTDVGGMVADVEEVNATFKAFIMRPKMYTALTNRRADAAVAGDKAGAFMWGMFREIGDNQNLGKGKGMLGGYPVIKSTNVSNIRSKGSATNLSYIVGGDFTDYMLALGGVVEFVLSIQGDTPFQNDQTWIRGILNADGAPRHEASFSLCDTLLMA